jgi:hypothetical protein
MTIRKIGPSLNKFLKFQKTPLPESKEEAYSDALCCVFIKLVNTSILEYKELAAKIQEPAAQHAHKESAW